MPLFFFDTDNGHDCMTDCIGTTLADKASADKEAVLCLAKMVKEVSPGFHEVTVLVKNENGSPIFRVTLALSRSCWDEVSSETQVVVPDKLLIVSCTSAMIN